MKKSSELDFKVISCFVVFRPCRTNHYVKKYYPFHIVWNVRSTIYGKGFPHYVERVIHICGKTNASALDAYFIFSDELVGEVTIF